MKFIDPGVSGTRIENQPEEYRVFKDLAMNKFFTGKGVTQGEIKLFWRGFIDPAFARDDEGLAYLKFHQKFCLACSRMELPGQEQYKRRVADAKKVHNFKEAVSTLIRFNHSDV